MELSERRDEPRGPADREAEAGAPADATAAPGAQAPPATTAAPAPQTMLRHLVEAARTLTQADAAALLLSDPTRAMFLPDTAVGLDEHWLRGPGLPAAHTLAAHVLDSGDLIEVRDTARVPQYVFPSLPGGRRPGALAVAPLPAEGTVVGVLEIYFAQAGRTALDREALRSFATLAGVTIATLQAHDREQTLRLRLEALDEASRAVASELRAERVLRRIVEVAARIVGARYGALGVVGDDGYLSDFITVGLTPKERALLGPLPRGHGLLGVLIRQGEPLRVPDLARDPRRHGFPPHHPPMTSLLGVPIRVHGTVVGDLYLTDKIGAADFSDEDQRLVEMLAAHAGIAIENARLYAQVEHLTQAHERERIARDLHDGIIQDIYAATLQLEDLAEDAPSAAVQERLLAVADRLSAVITDVRTYIQGLRARELEGRLLSEGLAGLCQEVESRSDLQVRYAVEGEPYRLPDAAANAVLQIAREGLSNVRKHAQATHAAVHLTYAPAEVTLLITDDGQGFDATVAQSEGHHGLRNMQARVHEVGGAMSVQSSPRSGTTLRVTLPRPL